MELAPVEPLPSPQTRRPTHLDDDEDCGDPTYVACEAEAKRTGDLPEPDQLEEARHRRPPAPVAPLWWGVYTFPWHAGGLRAWFLCGIGFGIVALIACGLHFAIDLYKESEFGRGGIYVRVMMLYTTGLIAFLVWTGAYAATFFLATIQDTAAGTQDVAWPDQGIWEAFLAFLYMSWLFACSAVPLGLAASLLQPALGSSVYGWSLIPSTILVFPFVLFSAMASNSWVGFDVKVCVSMVARPGVLLILWLMSALVMACAVGLGYLTIGNYAEYLFLSPLTGFVWSACLFIYARLLGRVGWLITGGDELARRPARRRRRRRVAE
jgi:hypothetical protein